MKYILLLPLLMLYSCDGMYPKEETPLNQIVPVVVPQYDTVDMVRIPDCPLKVKKPYYLIQWNDGTYGVLLKKEGNWYKMEGGDKGQEFTYTLKDAMHFKDSCLAKDNLQQYLDTRITYKIVK